MKNKNGIIDMDSQKQILLQLLEYIAKIAEENNIEYSLIDGSLLGAVRHGGIIPWDDDIDIILDVENYKKLLGVLKNKNRRYQILDSSVEDTYYYPYAKLIDTATSMEEIGCKPIKNYGVYVDIFCYHNAPKTKIGKILHYYKIQAYKIIFSGYAHKEIKKEYKFAGLKKIGKKYAEMVGIKKVLKKYNKLISKYDKKSSDSVINSWPNYGWKHEYQAAENIKKYKDCDFDGIKVKIFSNYNDILGRVFGDYMTPPPEDERVLSHATVARWTKKCGSKRKEIKKILHVTSISNSKGNGVAVSVSNYLKHENKLVDVAVYNLEDKVTFDGHSYSFSKYKTIASLPDGFSSPDLVVFNEIYKPGYLKLYKECIRRDIPYVIIPHGCLVEKAQHRKRIKKIFGNLLFYNKFIKNSLAIQYLNNNEFDNSIVKKHKYIISGNGVDEQKTKSKCSNKNFVYIGRYDINTKGLDLIMNAVLCDRNWFVHNKVKIYLYGRDSEGDYKKLKEIINKNDLSNIIVLNDALYGDEKTKVLLDAYVFVQTSRHEGQPMGIMEALSYGVPCILTEGTSFGRYVNDNRCGIGIEFDKKQLFEAIKKMYEDEKFRNACAKSAESIVTDYEWGKVTADCLKKYEALL